MALIRSNGTLDRDTLKSILEGMNTCLKRVLIPSGRLSVRLEIIDIPAKLDEVVRDFEGDLESMKASRTKSIFDGSSVKVTFPLVDYRLDSIPGAWDEYSSRAFHVAQYAPFTGIENLDSVIKFRTILAREIDNRLKTCDFITKNKLMTSTTVGIDFNNSSFANNKNTTMLQLEVSVVLAQF